MKMHLRSVLQCGSASLFLFGTAFSAPAQNPPGLTDKTIIIGSCSALEGPSHSLGVETVAGATAYFSLTNDQRRRRSERPKAQVSCLRRQLRSGQDASLFRPSAERQGLRHGILCGHTDSGEVRAPR